MKKLLAMVLALCMVLSMAPAASAAEAGLTAAEAEAAVASLNAGSDFYYELSDRYAEPDIEHRTEVRWWMAEGGHTDQTLEEEVQAIYDAGFRGIELCQLNVRGLDAAVWGYGSEQWNHDFHLVLNKALNLGMTIGITSGTNWSTTNVPGLDPDTDAGMQCIFAAPEAVAAGTTRTGKVPTTNGRKALRDVNQFIGAYAFETVPGTSKPIQVKQDGVIDLSDKVVAVEDGWTLDWTAPEGADYTIFYYWKQGTAQESKPSVIPAYCVNYLDTRGFEAWKEYFAANVLNDPELNEKIKNGDVQLFMDSLEFSSGAGATVWSEDFAKIFKERKGYDITPYAALAMGLENMWTWHQDYMPVGTYSLTDSETNERILNDLHDVQTELYMYNYVKPIEQWLNDWGIQLRAQISYGTYVEISEPSLVVDYPEAENRNQRNQIEQYRLFSGAAKLENKVLSSETGAVNMMSYVYDLQTHLHEAYALYASGFSRINWHIWSSSWSPASVAQTWPGFQSSSGLHHLGLRTPDSANYYELNQHLGRVQQLLREGKARSDVGMIFERYGEPTCYALEDPSEDMWMQRHDYMIFPSTELQEHGYTYEYFSPEYLKSENVYFDEESGTLELAGYKALVLWQEWLNPEAAENVLKLAERGLKIVIVDGAASRTPYNDGEAGAAALESTMKQLRTLDNVVSAATADDVMEALQSLGVEPYAGFDNEQILAQTREDENGNRYLYVWNYCDGSLHDGDDPDHGTVADTEITMDGTYIPYCIDSWTGEVAQLANYRWEDGKTIFPLTLTYGNIALYAFEPAQEEDEHLVSASLDTYVTEDGIVLRATESGIYPIETAYGNVFNFNARVPAAYDITGWDVRVESWTQGEEIFRTDTFTDSEGNTSVEHTYDNLITPIQVKLDKLTTWDNIPEVGKNVSGQGFYKATFQWDGQANGAYIDFGRLSSTMEIRINGVKTTDLNMNMPVIDVSDYLVTGENTIELTYSSNVTNVKLARGDIKARQLWGGADYKVDYRSYGPSQAVLIPYVQTVLPVSAAGISLSGETEATVGNALTYTVRAANVEQLATAELTIEIASEPEITAADGWFVISKTYDSGVLKVLLGNNAGMTTQDAGDLLTLTMENPGKETEVTVAVTKAVLSAYVGESEAFLPVRLEDASVVTKVTYSIYDVNRDGQVDQLDITRAQRCYGMNEGDQGWNPLADVNKDRQVDINDLILILNHYSK